MLSLLGCTIAVFLAKSNVHTDATEDDRGSWKKGMVVAVYEDGEVVEPPSEGSKLGFIHVPGWPKAKAIKYLESAIRDTPDESGQPVVVKRRQFIFDWSQMPRSIKRGLKNDREVTTTKAKVKRTIRDQVTGISEIDIVDPSDPIDPDEMAEAMAETTAE